MSEALWEAVIRLQATVEKGGVLMLPLAAVSLTMWFLIANRMFVFWRLRRKNLGAQKALEQIREGRSPDPQDHAAVSLLVARFLAHRSNERQLDRLILDETVGMINRSLETHLAAIGGLAAIAPLMGLLGTVLGMIDTFDVLALFGTGNPSGLTRGISEALISTQVGLLVAIGGLYMKGLLERRARYLKQHLAQVGYCLRRQL